MSFIQGYVPGAEEVKWKPAGSVPLLYYDETSGLNSEFD